MTAREGADIVVRGQTRLAYRLTVLCRHRAH